MNITLDEYILAGWVYTYMYVYSSKYSEYSRILQPNVLSDGTLTKGNMAHGLFPTPVSS
jgi:hypothetical protein